MEPTAANRFFPPDYSTSRARFRREFERVHRMWPQAGLETFEVNSHGIEFAEDSDLTIDWISAPPAGAFDKLLVLTTGEHGIEGFVGSAVMQLFLEEFLARLNPSDTGLLLVHVINPWGMVHHRRANARNVDLNRNFIWSTVSPDAGNRGKKLYDPQSNPGYTDMFSFLNPQRPVESLAWEKTRFLTGLVRRLVTRGAATLRQAALLGQYRYSCGIYYGGETREVETRHMMSLYRTHLPRFSQVVHLDIHTGYGPRNRMALVNSWLEPRKPAELSRVFDYPLVVDTASSEFYRIRGDMIDWVYHLTREEHPLDRFYATTFEFGTFGNSLPAAVRSLRTMVLENQLYWQGVRDPAAGDAIRRDFEALYNPFDPRWRSQVLRDARQAFAGILSAEGYLN